MKPKCGTCGRALKRPYHRIGAKGNWQGIKSWWFCDSCKLMEKNKNAELPEDVQNYLDMVLDIRQKPKIRQYSEGLVQVLEEVESVVHSLDQFFAFVRWQNLSGIEYNRQQSFEIMWVCEECNQKLQVPTGLTLGLFDEADIETSRPNHCENKMKLGVVNAHEYYYINSSRSLLDKIKENLDSDEDRASIAFLHLMISTLYNSGDIGLKYFANHLIHTKPQIKDLWGFSLFRMIIEILCRKHPMEELIVIPIEDLLRRRFSVYKAEDKIQNMQAVLDEIVEVTRNIDLRTSIEFRRLIGG